MQKKIFCIYILNANKNIFIYIKIFIKICHLYIEGLFSKTKSHYVQKVLFYNASNIIIFGNVVYFATFDLKYS